MEADSKQPGGGMWTDDLRKLAEKFQPPGLDIAALIEWQRKDMETLVEANRQAYAGVTALVERRNEIGRVLRPVARLLSEAVHHERCQRIGDVGPQGCDRLRILHEMRCEHRTTGAPGERR